MNRRAQRGFSLLEMTVVLVIVGLLGAALWRLLPLLRPLESREAALAQLAAAEQALGGFALTYNRLPCAASVAGGVEDCAGTGRWLPQATLGLDGPALRYGVYRAASAPLLGDADLGVGQDRYVPRLPPLLAGSGTLAPVNGLDLCKALHTGLLAPLPAQLQAGTTGVALAFALAHPGAGDASGDGEGFDGLNAAAGFELEHRRQTDAYDDHTRLVGFAELSGRLGCPAAIGRADGAARSAFVAYDNRRFAEMYHQFRVLSYDVRKQNTTMATWGVVQASVDMVLAIGTVTSGLYLAAATGGVGTVAKVKAVAVVAAAALNTAASAVLLVNAQLLEATAERQLDRADDERLAAITSEATALARAVSQHNLGLLP